MNRTLRLSMTPDTVEALKTQNNALYLFRAVRYGPSPPPANAMAKTAGYGGGYPVVWLRKTDYLASNALAWGDDTAAYLSTTLPLSPGVRIQVGDTRAVETGQKVTASDSGLGEPTQGREQGVVSIVSAATDAFSCGLSQSIASVVSPVCAFPLYPGAMSMIAPTARLLVLFAIDQKVAGQVVDTAYSSGLLIDFDDQPERDVSFDINNGWNAAGAVWASPVSADDDIVPLLILPADAA